jgi:hypothetical protein
MRSARRELEVRSRPGDLQGVTVIAGVSAEAGERRGADAVAVEPHDLVEPVRVAGHAELHRRLVSPGRVALQARPHDAAVDATAPARRREFVGVAVGQFAKGSDADGLQAGDDSRPAGGTASIVCRSGVGISAA